MIVMRQPCILLSFNFLTDVVKIYDNCEKAF